VHAAYLDALRIQTKHTHIHLESWHSVWYKDSANPRRQSTTAIQPSFNL